ncbi:5-formyltetrahydrofolate cyclo-ligase [Candidatus Curtissbacteria bacterium RIFCSPLOWO2_01_FULL_38_11b]|uniref:5-formyltetrahydrofolate cyclo-ligase n=1 Tax=Candidatus Curtissbacteria bacterium RIFCSPLOWO2_01_FULL_38_11b TaxID=1797725 RepID=A0A1F5H379_9BACT|nr:MAG: 5-formyltetrahydrofolate cyclo-ligase [Candidatus Curtissbacteria bacterium RIFCSPLOWO2_01_FULL_38_11b]
MAISNQKEIVRRELLIMRKKLSTDDVIRKSGIIEKKLINFLSKIDFSHILVYSPVNNEVLISDIADFLIRSQKKIYLPAYLKTEDSWILSEFKHFDDLEFGPFKILQPKNSMPVELGIIEVAILPSVALDKQGIRLGYGRGVYDKLLADFKGLKIGMAFDFQIVDKIASAKHDLVMDVVFTDKEEYFLSTSQ